MSQMPSWLSNGFTWLEESTGAIASALLSTFSVPVFVLVLAAGGALLAGWAALAARRESHLAAERSNAVEAELRHLRGAIAKQQAEHWEALNPAQTALSELQQEVGLLHRAVHERKRDANAQAREIKQAVEELRLEVVDQQTAKYRVNEAIRKAMSNKNESAS